ALLLANSAAPHSGQLYLGEQSVVGEWEREVAPGAPQRKMLKFAVPESGKIRNFDQIVVMFLTDRYHALIGPRIAIEEFSLIPR
ncbi:MAG TPA: hypothetical protein VF730_15605, partial [Terracidiphilus sp.]